MENTNSYEVVASKVSAKVAIANNANIEWFKDFGWELVPGIYNFDGIKIENEDYDPIVDGELGSKEEGIAETFKVKCPVCGEWHYEVAFSEHDDFPTCHCDNCNALLVIVDVKNKKM